MRLILALLFLLAACRKGEPAPAAGAVPAFADSACGQILFEGTRFTVCRPGKGRVATRWAGADGRPLRSFVALEHVLGKDADRVAFAMNAGMFGAVGEPIGLYVEDGRTVHGINRRQGGGNFHLMPNGVFLVRRDGRAEVVSSARYEAVDGIVSATQSGPMLVIDGAVNPRFDGDGPSRYVRNGVGIGPDGEPLFAISQGEVSFGQFARLFRDALKCRDALYLDGSVSSLWDPANGRRDGFAPIGPMIVAFKA